jgi:hypothetical protein
MRENPTVEWLEKCGDREGLVELTIVPAELLQTAIMFTFTDERSSSDRHALTLVWLHNASKTAREYGVTEIPLK